MPGKAKAGLWLEVEERLLQDRALSRSADGQAGPPNVRTPPPKLIEFAIILCTGAHPQLMYASGGPIEGKMPMLLCTEGHAREFWGKFDIEIFSTHCLQRCCDRPRDSNLSENTVSQSLPHRCGWLS